MPNQIIPKEKVTSYEVKDFINKYIPSVSHLNVLLLLYKSQHQEFGAKIIEEQLHLSPDSILKIFSDFVNNKMVSKRGEKSSCYCYLPDEDRNKILALLSEAYSKNRSEIINFILKRI